MYSFQNDYSEGMQPAILRALETINYHQNHPTGRISTLMLPEIIFRKH